MKKLLLFLIITSLIFVSSPLVFAQQQIIDAPSYILMDSKSGQVLSQFNPDVRMYPASTTKIMTALLAIEMGDMDQIMTASQSAVYDIGVDGMNIGIMAGEQLRLEDLVNALMVRSANETANIIAENLSPTRKDFVDMMNKRALELGATNTNFVNPCGAHNSGHYSTVGDMAKIARYAMSLPKFKEIAKKETYIMSPTNKHPKWPPLPATNKLLKRTSTFFTDVTGIKTGYTSQAGNNLVSSAVNKEGMELIAVVFGIKGPSSEKNVVDYSKELLEYGFKNYSIQRVVTANDKAGNIAVLDAKDDATLDLDLQNGLDCVLPNDKSDWNIEENRQIKSQVTAPINKGDVLGYIEYKRSGLTLGKVNVIASASIEKSIKAKAVDTAKNTVNTVKNQVLLKATLTALVILAAFFILRICLRRISRRRRAAARAQDTD